MRKQENLRILSSSGDAPTAEGINGSGDPAEFPLTRRLCGKDLERIRPILVGQDAGIPSPDCSKMPRMRYRTLPSAPVPRCWRG